MLNKKVIFFALVLITICVNQITMASEEPYKEPSYKIENTTDHTMLITVSTGEAKFPAKGAYIIEPRKVISIPNAFHVVTKRYSFTGVERVHFKCINQITEKEELYEEPSYKIENTTGYTMLITVSTGEDKFPAEGAYIIKPKETITIPFVFHTITAIYTSTGEKRMHFKGDYLEIENGEIGSNKQYKLIGSHEYTGGFSLYEKK